MSKITDILRVLDESKAKVYTPIVLQDKATELSIKIAKFVDTIDGDQSKRDFLDMLHNDLKGNKSIAKYMDND